jgi:glyoxylase-like metal-dependent hydrolase (beta-lactamase superfamily II)
MALHRDVADGVHMIEDAYVNWFLVEDGGGALTVVDAGHPASWRSLHDALAALGRTPGDIRAVVLTHGHFDHVGFAERARTELGVPVWAPEGERYLARHPWRYRHEHSRALWGLRHPGFLPRLAAMARAGALRVPGVRETRPYGPGPLDVPGSPTAIRTPGHTFDHHVLHLADRDVLIAGDAVVTFDPYTGTEGPKVVAGAATADERQALDSLDAIAATGAGTVLTGHGPPWREGAEAAAARARRIPPDSA